MPTYEYRCPEGHVFEKFQKMTEKPRARCPVCGKTAMRKISGGAGLVFKGSGFYITDYGKDGKGPRKPETEARPAAETTSDSGAKGDGTKPDAKPSEKATTPAKSSSRQAKGKAASE